MARFNHPNQFNVDIFSNPQSLETEEKSRNMKQLLIILTAVFLLVLSCSMKNQAAVTGKKVQTVTSGYSIQAGVKKKVPFTDIITPLAASRITGIWANDGGDKVTRDELRARDNPDSVKNMVWNGKKISIFGARNEVVSFNLVLEASKQKASGVTVTLETLNGPKGSVISSREAKGNDIFNYVGRNIELFFVRYLEIKGLSTDLFFHGYYYDERHIPVRMRCPHDKDGTGKGGWKDRPGHNKFYPEIAIPLVLETPFEIPSGKNQSVWADIYIPKQAKAGKYSGLISVLENKKLTWKIPVELTVFDFELPDLPNARTMLYYSQENINDRYLGKNNAYPAPGTDVYKQAMTLADRHFQLAHRHKISLIDTYTPLNQINKYWKNRLTGKLFTPARDYAGIGTNVGNNVYAIGVYGSWPWKDGGKAEMWANTDAWVKWFESQSLKTPTEYFLYLIDESDDYKQIERWAKWIDNNPGRGKRLMSMATISLPVAAKYTPSLDIPTSWMSVGTTSVWKNSFARYKKNPDKRLFFYNSNRPATGSFAIEDDGVALRVLAWTQYKMGIHRWFYWESTYYNNYQGNTGQTNVFLKAHTFGGIDDCCNERLGETGWNYLNGDGVLFYPGTDKRFPTDSYGVKVPFASLRLKHWRRGIQDVDYLVMAEAAAPKRTAEIVSRLIPRVMWEIGVSDPDDPTWVHTDISWPVNPDVWEKARMELAKIIVESLSR